MSIITQRSTFTTQSHSLIIEASPNEMQAFEEIAILLGASMDEENSHCFHFNFDSNEKSQQCLLALEKIWDNMQFYPLTPTFRIQVYCGNQSLFIEGDDEKFKVLVALIKSINKSINDNVVTFSENEQSSFSALCDALLAMNILPDC